MKSKLKITHAKYPVFMIGASLAGLAWGIQEFDVTEIFWCVNTLILSSLIISGKYKPTTLEIEVDELVIDGSRIRHINKSEGDI
jgi:hypothetical protein